MASARPITTFTACGVGKRFVSPAFKTPFQTTWFLASRTSIQLLSVAVNCNCGTGPLAAGSGDFGAALGQRELQRQLAPGGVIGGAGLDVFEAEPNVPEALRALPHVVLAPHIGSATSQTRQAMADLAFNNLKSHFDGHAVHTPVPECAHKG